MAEADGAGPFIVFEGGEGSGKTTQARRLAAALEAAGEPVVLTREPGGSPGAEAIRNLLLSGETDRWSARTEALLFAAARSDHVERTIAPARAAGHWLVCDRFTLSTRAYQGVDPQMREVVEALEAISVPAGARPDLVILLTVGDALARRRVAARGGAVDRMEAKDAAFHAEVRRRFRVEAAADPGRIVTVDADGSEDMVFDAVWAAVQARWPDRLSAAPPSAQFVE